MVNGTTIIIRRLMLLIYTKFNMLNTCGAKQYRLLFFICKQTLSTKRMQSTKVPTLTTPSTLEKKTTKQIKLINTLTHV